MAGFSRAQVPVTIVDATVNGVRLTMVHPPIIPPSRAQELVDAAVIRQGRKPKRR